MYLPTYLPTIIFAFVILTLIMSFIYFYLSTHGGQDPFIKFWGLGWLFYSLSLLMLIMNLDSPSIFYMSLRKIFDLFNIFFLLKGTYSFVHKMIPSYWNRFSIYIIIWISIGIFYNLDIMSIYLPVSTYQIILTLTLCFVILKFWDVPTSEKTLSVSVFFIWGVGKATLSLLEISSSIPSFYVMEIILSNILNFSVFIIYLQRTYSKIKIADRLYRIIAENATDVIFLYSLKPKPGFQYITPSVEKMTGYTPYDFYSDPRFYLQIVPSQEYDKIRSVFETENAPKEPYSEIFKIIHKSGVTIWAEIKLSTIFDRGYPIAIEGFIRDITTMKEAQTQLISSRKSRDLLLSYISHELKTPITSILGYVNAIKDGTIEADNDKEEAIDIIFSKTQTLRRLIDDLIQLSKLETKQFSFHFTVVKADELAKNLVDQHLMDIKSANIKVEHKINYKALNNRFLIVDAERITQVFSNIITNSIKYTKAGGKITIKIGSKSKKNYFYVSITDNGVGIDPKDLPYIFDRFYKDPTKPNRSTGLGLTISKEIITAHNGIIDVKSELNKGSTFTFYIPFYNK